MTSPLFPFLMLATLMIGPWLWLMRDSARWAERQTRRTGADQ